MIICLMCLKFRNIKNDIKQEVHMDLYRSPENVKILWIFTCRDVRFDKMKIYITVVIWILANAGFSQLI